MSNHLTCLFIESQFSFENIFFKIDFSPLAAMGKCEDPEWMGSDTYYPKGTVCYRDPSAGLFSFKFFFALNFGSQLPVPNLALLVQQ